MVQVSLDIGSIGANDSILVSLLDKKADADGKIRWQIGDSNSIADGATITFKHLKRFEAEGLVEPISFTINFVAGIAGNLLASYVYSRLLKYQDSIKQIKVNGTPVTMTKEQIEKAFSEAIEDAEKEN